MDFMTALVSLSPEIQRRVDYWLTGPFDAQTKAQVLSLKEKDPQGLIDAFFSDLSFGTGGLRGLMGPGTSRLNIYTIRLATQGLANYLRHQSKEGTLSVLIGFDSRHHSQEFAQEAAKVLAGNNIRVYLLSQLRPTPYVSFACRLKKASAAIMITASHNPKEYNGYKVFWSDGAQIVAPHDEGIVKEVDALKDLSSVRLSELDDPLIEIIPTSLVPDHESLCRSGCVKAPGLRPSTRGVVLNSIQPPLSMAQPRELSRSPNDKDFRGRALDAEYLQAIAPLQLFSEEDRKSGHSLKIVYTGLHGTGGAIVPQALESWGFSSLHLVDEQMAPDGDFPTVKFPNPEYQDALKLGIEYLERTQSDIALATDPDADRIGVVAFHQGRSVLINGNEMAAICVDFLCEVLPKHGKMPPKGAFVTTIVTTELLKKIAKDNQIPCFEVLTGFKYIGEKIHLWEIQEGYSFLFGAEESYGYLLGTHARDKDAIIASCLIAEIALYAKLQGQTLIDRLHHIYKKYGIFREKQMSIQFNPGKEGMEQMARVMHSLRANPPKRIGGLPVVCMEDYEKGTERLDLPQSDVLLFRLSDKTRLVIRPSGTEPKIKIYGGASSDNFSTIESGIQECDERLDLLMDALKKEALC